MHFKCQYDFFKEQKDFNRLIEYPTGLREITFIRN